MLARAYRLRRPREINRVFKGGSFGRAGGLQLKVLRTGLPTTRATIIVSRQISKKATVRNLIRRKLSAQLEELWTTIPAGYDIVVSVRQDLSEAPAPELKRQLLVALQQAGTIGAKNEKP